MSNPDSIGRLKQSVFLSYGAAFVSVAAALFIARWMQIEYEFKPLTPFLCAIMFSAWLGGFRPGLLALALSLLAFHHFFLSPLNPSGLEKEIPRVLLAVATALFIMSLTAAQRNATEALRESELRLRQIAENIREVFWMATGALDKPLYVSPAYESIWGRSVESLRQRPGSFFDSIHAEDREKAAGIIMEQREHELDVEYRIVRPNGTLRWIRDRRFPVKDASGTVYRIAGIAEDITERKQAEEALWHSERSLHEQQELYRMLTENANDFIRVHELDGRSIYASPSVLRLFGREPAHIFEFAHPEDLVACRLWWVRVLANSREPLVWRVRNHDGNWRWMETQGSVVQYQGQPHVMTVCRDVTEWKKAEETALQNAQTIQAMLAQEEEHLRLVLDTTPCLIHSGRPDGYLDYFNQRWLDYSGVSLQDVQGWAWTALIHPDDVDASVNRWRECLASGEPFENVMRLRRADGEYRWMLARKVPLRDEHGVIVKWYGSGIDIEDRKQAEHALRESQQLLQLVLATLPVGVGVTDCAGDFVLNNAASKGVWGDTIVAGPARWARSVGFWHDSGKRIAPAEWASVRALSEGQTSLNELIDIETFDGKKKVIQNSSAPIRNTEGQIVGAVIVNEDVTERVRAVEELQEAASRLEALSRRLVELQESERKELARELHDRIGQSLTALNINLKIIGITLPPQAGDGLRARLADSQALVESTTAAIRNVMSELRPPMLDDQGLVPALDWYAKQFTARTGISVAVRGPLPAERPAPAMEIALFRVVQEALNNVVKHARASWVVINFERSGSEYVMTVEDDGVGFDPVQDSALWQAGLGMVTMRERTQAVGGRLEVRAGRGDGTRLTVRVPA